MGLQLSTRGRYGMRSLCLLARNFGGEPISIQTISEDEKIPLRYLEQIMGRLKRENIVESIRGPKGGYWLGKDPKEITLGNILKVLEGNINLVWCLEDKDHCPHQDSCPTVQFWCSLNTGIKDFLNSTSLAQVIDGQWENVKISFSLSRKES